MRARYKSGGETQGFLPQQLLVVRLLPSPFPPQRARPIDLSDMALWEVTNSSSSGDLIALYLAWQASLSFVRDCEAGLTGFGFSGDV